jgi:2-polyprenyl-3-methyl-5-hydroxy-6-metoxy-1,4-benzoquinol methylase
MSIVSHNRTCAVCEGDRLELVLERPIADFIGESTTYDLTSLGLSGAELMGYTRCQKCSFIFASPTLDQALEAVTYNEAKARQLQQKKRPPDPEADALYQTHHKWVDLNPFVLGIGFHFHRFRNPRNPGQQRLRLLDIGCGYGHTLELARVFGVDGTGCDIDQSRLAACRAKGLRAIIPSEVEGTFDIIVSSNVIEHVFDLQGYIRMVKMRLADEGVFMFSGIEESVIALEKRRGRLRLLHPIEHRNILTRRSLTRLLTRHGLRLIRRQEIFKTIKAVRSKAPLFLPYLLLGGFVAVNGVFTAIAKHE